MRDGTQMECLLSLGVGSQCQCWRRAIEGLGHVPHTSGAHPEHSKHSQARQVLAVLLEQTHDINTNGIKNR